MTDLDTDRPTTPPPPPPEAGAGRPEAAHRHLGLALAVISVAQLMVVLDASIVNVALPSIQRSLHFSAANLIWVVNGYTLAFGGLLLLGGRTGDLFGRRRMFLMGVALFTTASLFGGLARSEEWLVIARVVQGVGAAVAAPTALALIASTFPEGRSRNRAMGVYAAMSGAGAAIGLLLGGVLTSALGWQWVLFVNVPVGACVVTAAPFVLGESRSRAGHLDLSGAVSSTVGMTLVVYGLIHAATTSWSDRWTLTTLSAGGLFLVGFVVQEGRSRHALMPLHLFSSRNRSTTYAIILATGMAVFSMFFFATLFMQDILGYGPLKAGIAYLPAALSIVVIAGVASRVVGRVGTKVLLAVGVGLAAAGLLWFSRVTPASDYLHGLLGPLLLTAAGMGTCFVPLTLNAVSGVPPEEQGIASALLNAGQQVGGSLGLAVLGTIAVEVTRGQVTQIIASVGQSGAQSLSRYLGSAPPPKDAPIPAAVHHAIVSAFVSGYTRAFAVGAAILVAGFVLSLFGLERRSPERATAGEAGVEAATP